MYGFKKNYFTFINQHPSSKIDIAFIISTTYSIDYD